ncbi:hypothetical protein XHV734_0048 [Xanthomonas hortorum pv. vitians]|nr:hypothetical protein XHV734_0048 [Xanthomonas hortorum pv. vitians]
MDVLAACPAMVGGQGPRSKPAGMTRFTAGAPELPQTAPDTAMIDDAQSPRLDSAFTRAKAAGDRSQ